MPTVQRSRRRLDHVVLPVSGLTQARIRLMALGFTVAENARHPFGTENACIFLADKTYIEPLAIGRRDDYNAAADAGNVFVAHDRAYRAHCGEDGFSAVVFSTDDAAADHDGFVAHGCSAGDMLEFSRPMRLPDGREMVASFRLAFAADADAPDLFCFTCQRIQSLPADRNALETHANGVTGISSIVFSAGEPAASLALLREILDDAGTEPQPSGIDLVAGNARISVLADQGMREAFGAEPAARNSGLQARAIVFSVADLDATERHLAAHSIPFLRRERRLVVLPAPGQGAILAFGD